MQAQAQRTRSSVEPPGMRFGDYSRLARDHGVALVLAALAGGAAGYVVPEMTLKTYESDATLIVQAAYPVTSAREAYASDQLTAHFAASFVELLEDRRTAQAVVDRLALEQDVSVVQALVTAESVPETSLIAVTARSGSARAAQRLVEESVAELVRRVNALQAAEADASPSITVLTAEAATLPGGPIAPQPTKAGVYGAVLAVLAVLGALMVRDTSLSTVSSVRVIKRLARVRGATCLSESVAVASGPLPRSEQDPDFYDQVRRLHREVLLAAPRPPQSLLVTSPSPRQGTTTVACALAEVLAQDGSRVLLIDAQLRRPGVLEALQRPAVGVTAPEDEAGLAKVLRDGVALQDALRPASRRPFTLLAGSLPATDADALLAAPALAAVLAEAQSVYDFVVVDSPPLLRVPDAAHVAAVVDGVLLVLRHGVTSIDALEAACHELADAAAPLVGAVLTFSPAGSVFGALLRHPRAGFPSRSSLRSGLGAASP